MNKIYTGIVTLVALVALVSSTAYAAFTSNVTFTGVTLGAATAGLAINAGGSDITGTHTVNATVDSLAPGESKSATFVVKNTGEVDFDLSVQTQITGYTNAALYNVISVKFDNTDNGHTSGWHTLNEWQTKTGLNDMLPAGDDANYKVTYKMDASAGSELAGGSVTFNISLIGDQPVAP